MRVKIEVFGKTREDVNKAIEKARRDIWGGACRHLHTEKDYSYSVLVSEDDHDPLDRPLRPDDFPEPYGPLPNPPEFPKACEDVNFGPKPATD